MEIMQAITKLWLVLDMSQLLQLKTRVPTNF